MNVSASYGSTLEPGFSVIIPSLNEADWIENAIRSVKARDPEVEIIVVDGGSVDCTARLALHEGVPVLPSPRGRGIQCNAGARVASGDILAFLHADTMLPSGAFKLLAEYFSNPEIQIGTFRLQFDKPGWLLRFYGFFTRWDSLFTRFGDQCIVIRRSFFEELGGFPDWQLFEDVHLLRLARQRTKIHSFRARVESSSRRFLRMGLIRCQLLNAWLILQYLLGISPERLASRYASRQLLPPGFLRSMGYTVLGVMRTCIQRIGHYLSSRFLSLRNFRNSGSSG
jgi:rSAM/selenodomain-associated transferase 2